MFRLVLMVIGGAAALSTLIDVAMHSSRKKRLEKANDELLLFMNDLQDEQLELSEHEHITLSAMLVMRRRKLKPYIHELRNKYHIKTINVKPNNIKEAS